MELRLATFNLENLGIRNDEESAPARARLPLHVEALRNVLRRLDADAVAVQEVLDPDLLTELAHGLGYPHVVLSERGSSPLLVGVIARHPLREARAVAKATAFSLVDEKTGLTISMTGDFSRAVLSVLWDVPGFRTNLFVVHWKSKIPTVVPEHGSEHIRQWSSHGHAGQGRFLTELKRLAQAVELRKVIDARLTAPEGGRVIVLGDFNDTLDSECLRILRGDSRACGAPNLVPTELIACEDSIPQDLRFTQIYRGRREMLDHVLISRDLLPHFRAASILHEDMAEASEGPDTDPFSVASDHAPVAVTFRVP